MLLDLSIKELAQGLQEKKFSSVDLVQECYANIERHDSTLNSFITVLDKDSVLKTAAAKDQARNKDNSPLHGIPFVLKDSYLTKGIRTTAASNVLQDYTAQYNATVYQKLLDSGAILIGKNNMDAWGHGATSENTDMGPVKNPWDTQKVAGGSSGGTAVAVSTRMAAFGIGEDTGGSIRNPSAWNNTTGLKVTYGRVSRYGCIAYASSFDTVGPMAKTTQDCAYILKEIAGLDPKDATSSPHEVADYTKELTQNSLTGITIGMPQEFYSQGLDSEINQAIQTAAKLLAQQGAEIKQISMPMFDYGVPVYYLIGPSETSSNLARYDGIRYGNSRKNFTPETARRIMIGTYALSSGYYDAYYKKAQKARTLFIQEYQKALTGCDVLLIPVTPTPPPKLGELMADPLQNMLMDVYTTTQNPVGVPALAVPCGFTKTGLPIGMQLVSKMFSESLLFQLGHIYQQHTNWHTQKPKLS